MKREREGRREVEEEGNGKDRETEGEREGRREVGVRGEGKDREKEGEWRKSGQKKEEEKKEKEYEKEEKEKKKKKRKKKKKDIRDLAWGTGHKDNRPRLKKVTVTYFTHVGNTSQKDEGRNRHKHKHNKKQRH